MNRLRSIVFSTVCVLLLGCVLIAKGLEHSPLSSVVADACKETSQLEGRDYEHFPELALGTVTGASFQSDFEQYVADSIPYRDQALMLNAGLQRSQIALANRVFGFACYPTFYGSDYVYVPEHDAIVQTLRAFTPNHEQAMERAAGALNALAESNGGVSFYLFALDRADASDANPTADLVPNPLTYSTVDELFYSRLNPAVTVFRHPYRDEHELFESLYRTDHHWHTATAYDSYSTLVAAMIPGATPAQVIERVSYDEVDFWGSCSRSGLCEANEPDRIDDLVIDMSSYTVVRDDQEFGGEVLAHREAYLGGNVNADTFMNRYAEYFHGDWGLWRIANPNAQTGRSLLIVRDSFGGCMERFFAANYAHVYVVDFRHTDTTVPQLLAEHPDIDDVLVMMGWNNLTSEATMAGFTS